MTCVPFAAAVTAKRPWKTVPVCTGITIIITITTMLMSMSTHINMSMRMITTERSIMVRGLLMPMHRVCPRPEWSVSSAAS